MTKPASKDFSYAMGPIRILSWPIGTWPLQKYNFMSSMRCFVSVILLLVMLSVVHTEMYLDRSDAEKNMDAVVLMTCCFLAVWKVIWFRIRSKGLVANFLSALKDYDELNDQRKKVIVRRHARMGRAACGTVMFCSYFGSTLFTTVPMLAGEDKGDVDNLNVTREYSLNYPLPSECTVNMLNLPASLYPAIYIGEYILLLVTSTGNFGGSAEAGIQPMLRGRREESSVPHPDSQTPAAAETFQGPERHHQPHHDSATVFELSLDLYKRIPVHTVFEHQQHRDGGENDDSSGHSIGTAVRIQLRGRIPEDTVRGCRLLYLLQQMVQHPA
ncbi:uncharacterized protein LOC143259222 isoform X3 [Megalopta genalis]|uniref:uncharacterized protein LOC143259222 isoform X3 n=1 Tax=Megalopta genalis TaxID=115081 RepID=UPI003FD24AB7